MSNVKSINESLAEIVKRLKGEQDETSAKEIVEEGNNLIRIPIVEYPTKANAVIIDASVYHGMDRTHMRHSVNNFEGIKGVLKYLTGKDELNNIHDVKFVKHLPYEYQCDEIISNTVKFQKESEFEKPNSAFTSILIELEDSMLPNCLALFPDEINSIKIGRVNQSEYSPNFEFDTGKTSFPESYVSHYLIFRGFTGVPKEENFPHFEFDPKEEMKKINDRMSRPSYQIKNLLDINYNNNFVRMNGFIVVDMMTDPILYELNDLLFDRSENVHINQMFKAEDFSGMNLIEIKDNVVNMLEGEKILIPYAISGISKPDCGEVIQYNGENIIKRLSKIDVVKN